MTKIHVDTNTSKSSTTLFKSMTNEYKDATEPVSPALPSPTSVILDSHTKFNTNIFRLDFDSNKWFKSKIIDVNKKGILSIVFSTNNNEYHIWKCKIFFKDNCKINNKFLNVFLRPLINKHVKIKCYKMSSENILLIDISTDYLDPQNTTLLSDVIVSKYADFLTLTKSNSKIFKLYDIITQHVIKLYNYVSDRLGGMYYDFLIDNVIEEKITEFIASSGNKNS